MWPARRTRSSQVASHPSIAPGLLTSRRRRFRVGARSIRRDGVYCLPQPAHQSGRTRSAMGSELWSAPPPGIGRRSRPFLWKGGPARRMFLVRAWEAIPERGGRRTRPVCGKSSSSRCWTQRRLAFITLFPSSEIKSDPATYPTACSPFSLPCRSHDVAILVLFFGCFFGVCTHGTYSTESMPPAR